MASTYLFTFYFKGAAKILNEVEGSGDTDEPPFVSVFATTYARAVSKVIKLKLPNVSSEDELRFGGVSEDFLDPDDDKEEAKSN
jgi:hypothetical protein